MSKHQLWYSAKCRHCQAFLEELTKTPFVPQFQLICIDPSPNRPPLPSWLKVVPSLMVRGEFEPRVGPGPVNNWLFEAKMGGGNGASSKKTQNDLVAPVYNSDMNSRGDIPRPSPAGAGNQSAMPSGGLAGSGSAGEPLAYYGSEMAAGKWSDSFSFITDQSVTAEKGLNPIERNFQSVLPPGAGSAIGGPSMMGGGGGGGGAANRGEKRSAKEDALLRDFEAYSASRDRDVAGPIARK